MKTQQPTTPKEEHRVIAFRRYTLAHLPDQWGNRSGQTPCENANDPLHHGQNLNEPNDFRHRMLANIVAFTFTAALVAVGIWLATSIRDLRKTQDCVLMGRRDCARISVLHF